MVDVVDMVVVVCGGNKQSYWSILYWLFDPTNSTLYWSIWFC